MLTIKDAIAKVETEFVELFGRKITDIRLKEIQTQRREYNLTVSFLIPSESPYLKTDRLYKDVFINKKTGVIISIKMNRD